MNDCTERAPSAFRLNLEQQKNRAQELLRAVKAGDAEALSYVAMIFDTAVLAQSSATLRNINEARWSSVIPLDFSNLRGDIMLRKLLPKMYRAYNGRVLLPNFKSSRPGFARPVTQTISSAAVSVVFARLWSLATPL
jgi:hypothetical protein